MTLLLTTHYLDEADAMAERIVLIDHGTIIADATPAALKREYADDVVTVEFAAGRSAAAARSVLPTSITSVTETVTDTGAVRLALTTNNGPELVPALLRTLDSAGVPAGPPTSSRRRWTTCS